MSDDLLAGFKGDPSRVATLRGFFAVTIVGSLLLWDLAFTAGAYHTVFYDRAHQVLVVSIVVLLAIVLLRGQLRVQPWLIVVFALPLVWIVFRLLVPFQRPGYVLRVVDDILVTLMAVALPLILWVIARLLAPDYFTLPGARMKATAAGIVLTVGLLGFLVGEFHERFVSCEEFTVAGDHQPEDCVHEEP